MINGYFYPFLIDNILCFVVLHYGMACVGIDFSNRHSANNIIVPPQPCGSVRTASALWRYESRLLWFPLIHCLSGGAVETVMCRGFVSSNCGLRHKHTSSGTSSPEVLVPFLPPLGKVTRANSGLQQMKCRHKVSHPHVLSLLWLS